MNKEIIKAMNKKEKKYTIRKWWNNNRHIVMRIVFFPIWIYILTCEKVKQWLNSRAKWSNERANEILNYYIPRRAEWIENEKEFYFFDNGYGWAMWSAKKYLKRKDRRFWKKHTGFWGGEIRNYLIKYFELEGFVKKIIDKSNGYTEISFKMD